MSKDHGCPPFEVTSDVGTVNPTRQIGPAKQEILLAMGVFQQNRPEADTTGERGSVTAGQHGYFVCVMGFSVH